LLLQTAQQVQKLFISKASKHPDTSLKLAHDVCSKAAKLFALKRLAVEVAPHFISGTVFDHHVVGQANWSLISWRSHTINGQQGTASFMNETHKD